MNLLQLLYFSEIRINQLSLFQKIQLYLLPVLLASLFLYHWGAFNNPVNAIPQVQKRKSNINPYVFMKKMQTELARHFLQLHTIQEQHNGLSIEVEGKLNSLLYFISFCEQYGSINTLKSIELTPNKSAQSVVLKLQLQFNEILYQHQGLHDVKKSIASLHNPFQQAQSLKNEALKLHAIINHEVLINHQWLKINEMIHEYRLVKIEATKVLLRDSAGHVIELVL